MENREIIETYYRKHQAELLTFVCSRLDNRELAEDIVQDVFLRLLCNAQPIMECTLPALALTIARHLINDYYRRRNCHLMFSQQLNPNPATDVLNIEVNASQASEMSISVFNIMGQNVMNQTVSINTGINTRAVNISELNSGIYFVTVKANGFENTMKFIVK